MELGMNRRPPRIAIAGSSTLPAQAALPAFNFLLTAVYNPVLLLRRGISTPPGRVEFVLALQAKLMDWKVEWYVPQPGGRDRVFYRDIDMVAKADVVLCVFPRNAPMEGGTSHVVEKAQDRGVPVYAYTFDPINGHWERLGEWDPHDSWAHKVPVG